jgi:hypothetical protein
LVAKEKHSSNETLAISKPENSKFDEFGPFFA